MNEPLIRWLMAPDAPEVPLTLEAFHRRPEWQQDAACRGQGVRAWFPGAPEQLDRARAVCGGCAVRSECFAYAMADDSLVGIWAGLTERERRRALADRFVFIGHYSGLPSHMVRPGNTVLKSCAAYGQGVTHA
jgi:hypothetical protein